MKMKMKQKQHTNKFFFNSQSLNILSKKIISLSPPSNSFSSLFFLIIKIFKKNKKKMQYPTQQYPQQYAQNVVPLSKIEL